MKRDREVAYRLGLRVGDSREEMADLTAHGLAATPVVAVRKSIWLVSRTRAVNKSFRGIKLELAMLGAGE